jgi:protein ImuB
MASNDSFTLMAYFSPFTTPSSGESEARGAEPIGVRAEALNACDEVVETINASALTPTPLPEGEGLNSTASHHPFAVSEERKGKTHLHQVNETARRFGLEPGMTAGAAFALCPQLIMRPRDTAAEAAAMGRLAEIGLDFTPWVSLDQPGNLLLEIRASLKLFGGAENLREKLRQRLISQNHRPVIAITPSAEASALLANTGAEIIVTEREELRSVLGPLPLATLALDEKTEQRMARTGIRRLADLWRLPRDGLTRRYGATFLRHLDRLAGSQPQVLSQFHQPPRFFASHDLPMELERLDHFFAGIALLAERFAEFLKIRDAAALSLSLNLHHHAMPATRLELRFRSAHRDAAHWLSLLREKLERSPLSAPVTAITLSSDAIAPFEPERPDLFEDRRPADRRSWHAVLEQLQAHLGRESLLELATQDDHRPERAMRHGAVDTETADRKPAGWAGFICPPHDHSGQPDSLGNAALMPNLQMAKALNAHDEAVETINASVLTLPSPSRRDHSAPWPAECALEPSGLSPSSGPSGHLLPEGEGNKVRPWAAGSWVGFLISTTSPPRPCWLLPQPTLLDARGIRLLSEPERIESGWWDGGAIRRDYFMAKDRRGRRLWVFHELNPNGQWYLHGLFG